MHSHPQPRGRPRGLDTPGKRSAIGQQRSAGHNPVMEGLEDSAVYALGPAQVIRIDDQILHGLSHSPVCTCPLGQLLVCAPAQIRTIDRFRPQL